MMVRPGTATPTRRDASPLPPVELSLRLDAAGRYAKEHMPNLPYHNPKHADAIVEACTRIALAEGIPFYERSLLLTAAYLHDVVYVPGAKDNEERSAQVAARILPQYGYTPQEIRRIEAMIMATKLPTRPGNKLARIICDADVENLGTQEFWLSSERLRRELGVEDRMEWLRSTRGFLQGHRFYTRYAQEFLQPAKEERLSELEELVRG